MLLNLLEWIVPKEREKWLESYYLLYLAWRQAAATRYAISWVGSTHLIGTYLYFIGTINHLTIDLLQ